MNEYEKRFLSALENIDFWLGAIASNQQTANRLKAHELGIECVWHDPSVEPWPNNAKHGKVAKYEKLLIGVPKHQRKGTNA